MHRRRDPRHIGTSFVERQNLTTRMSMRRFTRLSKGFSNKAENHAYSVAIRFVRSTSFGYTRACGVRPAMAAGVTSSCGR